MDHFGSLVERGRWLGVKVIGASGGVGVANLMKITLPLYHVPRTLVCAVLMLEIVETI
jgi:hypothetical protein